MGVRKICIFVVLLLMFCIITACTSQNAVAPSNTGSPNTKETSLKVALSVNAPTLDMQFTTATVTRQIGSHIFETLLTYDENYKVVPMLAESFTISGDGLTTTLVLRKDVKFHNGKTMTAADVIASINRWKEVSSIAKTTFNTVTAINAKDDYTVVIVSSQPSSVIVPALASPTQSAVIAPKELMDKAGKAELKEYIGTGPYKFVDWKQDQYVQLTRFDDYKTLTTPASGFAGKKEALIKDLYFYFATNSASRIAGLQSGEYDFAEGIPIDNYDTVKNDTKLQVYIGKPSKMNLLFFNKKAGVFKDLKVRQAVNAALDLNAIMMAAAAKQEFFRIDPGLMFLEQKDWYSDAGKELLNQKSPEKAKQLLKEAGYNGQQVTIMTSKEFDFLYKSSLVISEQLKQIGMNIKLEVYDWPTVLEKRKDPNTFDIYFTYATLYPHPSQITYVDSRKAYPGWYSNPEVDKLMDKLVVTTNQAESKAIFDQIQKLYNNDVPTIKLGDMFALAAGRSNVKNFDYFYDVHFWNVSLK